MADATNDLPQPSKTSIGQLPKKKPPSVSLTIVFPPSSSNTTLPSLAEHQQVRAFLQRSMGRSFLPLAAVLETPTTHSLQHTKPLPLRTSVLLTTVSYPKHIQSCSDIPNRWPVGHSQELDSIYGSNVGRLQSLYQIRFQYANTTCPVDADPFLPWIHDVVVDAATGTNLDIVAHNKRRCRRDPRYFRKDIDHLEPQVALMQSIPIQQLFFNSSNMTSTIPNEWKDTPRSPNEHWYRLVPIEQADPNSRETRFLCQFHTLRPTSNTNMAVGVEKVVVGETWSTYPYNYEHANYQHRRGQTANPMLTRPMSPDHVDGIHNEQVWNAMLHFRCPIPLEIQQRLMLHDYDDIPSFYVDIVPVRTPPRENVTGYAPPILQVSTFDPLAEWGTDHILPPVRHSGRWANIPICPSRVRVPKVTTPSAATGAAATAATKHPVSSHASRTTAVISSGSTTNSTSKPRFMVGCLWASAVFSERGSSTWDTHTIERLLEWLTYHLEIAGFDHMVVYDNTEAHTNVTSLQSATDLFPSSKVTRIPWKHRVCNNNPYEHPNAGERSSQYAAEASCRVRYGPTTEWLAFFDTDEYLIPSGNWSSIRDWLQMGVQQGTIGPDTHILSFYETKAFLNYRFTEPFVNDAVPECTSHCTDCDCRQKRSNATYLESFCEPFPFPREFPKTKAKMKQIYRPAFVLNHFVHYATVTNFVHTRPHHPRVVGWPYERRAKEFTEAYMVHTKTRSPPRTSGWKSSHKPCGVLPHKCPVGLAFPFYQGRNATNTNTSDMTTLRKHRWGKLVHPEFGFPFNCWELEKVQHDLAGRLHAVLDPLMAKWRTAVGPDGVMSKQAGAAQ